MQIQEGKLWLDRPEFPFLTYIRIDSPDEDADLDRLNKNGKYIMCIIL